MPPRKDGGRRLLPAAAAALLCLALFAPANTAAAAAPQVLLVGTYKGIAGGYTTIQDAVNHAHPGDWILVAPGDYHEAGVAGSTEPAGVLITTAGLHLRGMDRNQVIVDGTRAGAPACSASAADQVLGRNGVEVLKADAVYVENLTVCNFVTTPDGHEGNQVWWNGGDGSGRLGMNGYWGNYLTATSTYANGFDYPAGNYGIFSSNATNGSFVDSYASNMADSAFYIGACQQSCNVVMNRDHGQFSSLCLSSTNAGGRLLVENTECDLNKTGLVSNSQNNDDWPPPQIGLCPNSTRNCTVWMNNYVHDNNNPNVPGNGTSGLAGQGPVGTGLVLGGSRYVTLQGNRVENNGAWGELIADLPDQEAAPDRFGAQCLGGIWVPAVQLCYFEAYGNVSIKNHFKNNGFFGNPTNGDIGLATLPHNPGNCFAGDTDPARVTTDPPGMETNPLYRPVHGMCTTPNGGDEGPLAVEGLCDTQLLAPCPTLNTLCLYNPSLPCLPVPGQPFNYPRPTKLAIGMPPPQATMKNPCAGVPANPWCP